MCILETTEVSITVVVEVGEGHAGRTMEVERPSEMATVVLSCGETARRTARARTMLRRAIVCFGERIMIRVLCTGEKIRECRDL